MTEKELIKNEEYYKLKDLASAEYKTVVKAFSLCCDSNVTGFIKWILMRIWQQQLRIDELEKRLNDKDELERAMAYNPQ